MSADDKPVAWRGRIMPHSVWEFREYEMPVGDYWCEVEPLYTRASPAPDDGVLGASLRDTHREADGAVLDALNSARAWLYSWGEHVGSCRGGGVCTCGLTAIRERAAIALEENRNGPDNHARRRTEAMRKGVVGALEKHIDASSPLGLIRGIPEATDAILAIVKTPGRREDR